MNGGVHLDRAAITELTARLRAHAVTWSSQWPHIEIDGVTEGIAAASKTERQHWIDGLTTSSTAVYEVATNIDTRAAAFFALDESVVKEAPEGPR